MVDQLDLLVVMSHGDDVSCSDGCDRGDGTRELPVVTNPEFHNQDSVIKKGRRGWWPFQSGRKHTSESDGRPFRPNIGQFDWILVLNLLWVGRPGRGQFLQNSILLYLPVQVQCFRFDKNCQYHHTRILLKNQVNRPTQTNQGPSVNRPWIYLCILV